MACHLYERKRGHDGMKSSFLWSCLLALDEDNPDPLPLATIFLPYHLKTRWGRSIPIRCRRGSGGGGGCRSGRAPLLPSLRGSRLALELGAGHGVTGANIRPHPRLRCRSGVSALMPLLGVLDSLARESCCLKVITGFSTE